MSAPREPPAALLANYTLNGAIPLEKFYVDEASFAQDVRYSRADLHECVGRARQALEQPRLLARRGGGVARDLVAQALAPGGDAAVQDANVVVFGATDPWVECLCVASGAKSVVTVEYQKLAYDHPIMRAMPAADFERDVLDDTHQHAASFDVAIALSSFDHDVSARYPLAARWRARVTSRIPPPWATI